MAGSNCEGKGEGRGSDCFDGSMVVSVGWMGLVGVVWAGVLLVGEGFSSCRV